MTATHIVTLYGITNISIVVTWPELPKQFSTIAMRLALASLFTVNKKKDDKYTVELLITIRSTLID